MPINLFSTKSTRPIAFFPANVFNLSNSFSGFNFFPLIAVGSLFLKVILTIVFLSGAFSGETVLWNIISGAEFFGFSKTFPSVDVWKILSSIEKGGAPFLSFGIGILFFFAYLIKSLLDWSFHTVQGAITLIF